MAVELLGSGNDRVDIGDVAEIAGLTGFTLAVSIKPSAALSVNDRICHQWGGGGTEHCFLSGMASASNVGFVVNDPSDNFLGRQASAYTISLDVWHHFVFAYAASTTIEIWANGQRIDDSEWLGSNSVSSLNNSSRPIQLGHSTHGAGLNGIDGDYCEWAAWNVNLSNSDKAARSKGFSSDLIRPDRRIWHIDLVTTVSVDRIGARSIAYVGAANAGHAPIINRRRNRS